MAAAGLVCGEGCWGSGELVNCVEAGTVAEGMGVARLSSGFESRWAVSVALLVKYMRHGWVDMAYMIYEIFCTST